MLFVRIELFVTTNVPFYTVVFVVIVVELTLSNPDKLVVFATFHVKPDVEEVVLVVFVLVVLVVVLLVVAGAVLLLVVEV